MAPLRDVVRIDVAQCVPGSGTRTPHGASLRRVMLCAAWATGRSVYGMAAMCRRRNAACRASPAPPLGDITTPVAAASTPPRSPLRVSAMADRGGNAPCGETGNGALTRGGRHEWRPYGVSVRIGVARCVLEWGRGRHGWRPYGMWFSHRRCAVRAGIGHADAPWGVPTEGHALCGAGDRAVGVRNGGDVSPQGRRLPRPIRPHR